MSKILITGANGFIGQHLIQHSNLNKSALILLTRRKINRPLPPGAANIIVDLNDLDKCKAALSSHQIDTVIHLAASVHQNQTSTIITDDLKQININFTSNLAKMCINQGLKRFIFMSSIGVHGFNSHSMAINETQTFEPQNAYTKSKVLAEESLNKIFLSQSNCKLNIIRPPMVYGPNSLGSFRLLIKALQLHLPLPFKNVHNQKSFISINNLTDFIIRLLETEALGNEVFTVADKEIISTSELIQILKMHLNSKTYSYACPQSLIKIFFHLLHKENLYQSLYGNSAIDTSKAKKLLNWEAPFDFSDEIGKSLR